MQNTVHKALRAFSFRGVVKAAGLLQQYRNWDIDGEDIKNKLYYDAPYAFALRYVDGGYTYGLACVSFKIDANNSLKVVQLQGMRGKKKELQPIRWEKMFIDLVGQWAKDNGASKLKVQAAKSNIYEGIRTTRRGKRRYDKTALEMGFLPSKGKTYYYKSLQ
ncbi:MAG: hypothetical protein HY514_00325 [Candidatus Aenigmarchaeota archaeon]|nr:hypothetical protein [Candidatus Aenigmarchaeota archaeon]